MRALVSSVLVLSLLTLLPACKREGGSATGADAGGTGAAAAGGQGGIVTVKGSDTMVLLGQRWAEALMKKSPEVRVQVTGGGSGTGLAALINGTTEIAMSSRDIKDAERQQLKTRAKVEPMEIPVAKDGVTFYVHESNPVGALTAEQLRGMYMGDITNWKEVGGPDAPVVIYSRENSSGTYAFVKEVLLQGEDFAPEALTLPGTAAVVNAVSKEVHGIGYGGAAYGKGIKELKIKQGDEEIAPSAENIQSGKYPLSRNLYFFVRGEPSGAVKQYIDFALSPEGQQIVSQVGYFPLK